jgi:hypothetical protein
MEQQETNLSEMIRENNPPVFEESSLDLPEETTTEETDQSQEVEEPQVETIPITQLNTWFEANAASFENVKRVQVVIRGVDASKTLIMAVLDGQGTIDGHPSRDLQVFKNADVQPVLNLPATDMQVYNNGFRLIYPYGENESIKCYGVRTGLICVFCNIIDSKMIPHTVVKVKKKDTSVEVIHKDVAEVMEKLTATADLETLQLLYKQKFLSMRWYLHLIYRALPDDIGRLASQDHLL